MLIEAGNTRVLCAASIEENVPGFLRGSGKGWVTAEYSMLPRATATRTPREVSKGRRLRTHYGNPAADRPFPAQRGRSGRAGRAQHHPRLRRPAGRRRHALRRHHRSLLALAGALRQLVKFGALKKSPVRDHVAAVSVGILGGVPLLDLCYQEDSQAEVDMNIVMTGSGRFVEVQATAEKTSFR